MATVDEVVSATLPYFDGDVLAANTFATKYALTDRKGDILELTPDDMFRRIAREFARIEARYPNPLSEGQIFDQLTHFGKIIPQGSPLSGIGNPFQIQSLSNCFVIEPPYDSYGGILKTDQEMVQIAKRRGGVGFDVSSIRPKGMSTSNAAKTTDGIEVFMQRFSNSCKEVAQEGRRGALMMTCSVHHPQILDFIKIKRDKKRVTGANISIRLSDEFLAAVESGSQYQLRFPVDSKEPIVTKMIDAKTVWDEIIESAHGYAEPGLLFWDNIIRNSPADIYESEGFKTVSTNPCGEIPLCAYDSCRLMLMNLFTFVRDPFTPEARFATEDFRKSVIIAQRLMDDLIDLELEQIDKIMEKIETDPEPEDVKELERSLWKKIRAKAIAGRRTGLGVTAVGDALAALGTRYGSDVSIELVELMYKELATAAYRSSCIMAEERGAFPIYSFEKELNHPFIERILDAEPGLREMSKKTGRRNISLLTTAPAGTVSVESQTTSGIEPAFLIGYTRRKKINTMDENAVVDFIDDSGDRWTEYEVFHHNFNLWMKVTGKTRDQIEESPYWGATSADVNWVQKVKLQAAAQKWICHAISNTTNLPKGTSKETVMDVYTAGWKSGCKGVTVYVDGCRSGVLITNDDNVRSPSFVNSSAPKRPETLPCDIYHSSVGSQNWTIIVGLLDGRPYEIMGGHSTEEITKKSKKGFLDKKSLKSKPSLYTLRLGEGEDEIRIKDVVSTFENPNHSSFTRLLSLSLRHGASANYIVEQLLKGDKDADLFSFAKVISRVFKQYISDGTKPGGESDCKDCGAPDGLIYVEGCVTCSSCGASKCS